MGSRFDNLFPLLMGVTILYCCLSSLVSHQIGVDSAFKGAEFLPGS